MEFKRVVKTSRFLDPASDYAETERFSEVRYDPLAGHTSRILGFPLHEIKRDDIEDMVDRSRGFCPFCPEVVNLVTPKFAPDLAGRERYARGEALCVPNAFPYDENGAVTVMTHEHFVPLTDFTQRVVSDAVCCCIDYLADLTARQPDMYYQSINWNYMPLAGGSIVHPHLQVTASSTPTNYYSAMRPALERYRQAKGSHYWLDLVDEERRLGERYIGGGDNLTWLVAFAPMGVFDIIGVLPCVTQPAQVAGGVLEELAAGILGTLNYIDSLNMHSFNMSLYFFLGDDLFTPHLRICPRVSIPPLGTSQINYMRMLHNESMTIIRPEDVCTSIRGFLGDAMFADVR